MTVNSSLDITTIALVGGNVALDLANTVSGRRGGDEVERLLDFGDVVTWARRAGLLEEDAVRVWRGIAEDEAAGAANLSRVRELRELIYGIFTAIADGQAPAPDALRALEAVWKDGARSRALIWTDRQAIWQWPSRGHLAEITGPIAAAAVDLLGGDELARVRQCRADDCEWLFVDTSRNRSRRWCDMADCGNRAKARRHYRRIRETR